MSHPNLEKMLTSRAVTRKRREAQTASVRELKLTRANQTQQKLIHQSFLEAKWLTNSIIATGVLEWTSSSPVQVKLPDGTLEDRSVSSLHAHVRQNIHRQLKSNLKALDSNKKAGRKIGSLRFRKEVNSLEYSTGDVRWNGENGVFLPKLGWMRFQGTNQLKNQELANARFVRRATGYYLLVTIYKQKLNLPEEAFLPPVGLDMGVRTLVTISDGREFHSLVKENERLKRLQRKLQRSVKGSNNWHRTKLKLNREYEKIDNRKNEQANQLVSLLKQHETVYYQDENLRAWKTRYGKQTHHSSLGRVKSKLSRLDSSVMLDKWVPTTQQCQVCFRRNKLALSERVYSCACGYSKPRDLHAAENMVLLGLKISSGQELSGAPVDQKTAAARPNGLVVSSTGLKQETNDIQSLRSSYNHITSLTRKT